MAGYIYPDSSLQWSRMGDPIIGGASPRYEVGFRTGTRLAQNGGEGIGRSRVSSLEIQEPELEDSGVYTCLIDGADTFAEISLTVLEVKGNEYFLLHYNYFLHNLNQQTGISILA